MGAVQLKSSTLSQLSSQISKINMSPKPEDEVTDAAAAQTEEAKTEETVEAGEAAAAEPEAAEGEAVEEKKEKEKKYFIYFKIMKKPCHTSSDRIPSLQSS